MKKRSRFGFLEIIVGISMIALGIYTFMHPHNFMSTLIRVYAVVAVFSGIRDVVFFCRTDRYTGFRPILSLTGGIVSLMAGITLFLYPNAGSWIVSLLIPLWFIGHSIFQLASIDMLHMMTSSFHYYFSLIASVVGLCLGFLLLIRPDMSIAALAYLIASYLVIAGINSIVIAFSDTGFWGYR